MINSEKERSNHLPASAQKLKFINRIKISNMNIDFYSIIIYYLHCGSTSDTNISHFHHRELRTIFLWQVGKASTVYSLSTTGS